MFHFFRDSKICSSSVFLLLTIITFDLFRKLHVLTNWLLMYFLKTKKLLLKYSSIFSDHLLF